MQKFCKQGTIMLKKLLPLCLLALASIAAHAVDLVLAENGKSDYQIVIPDKAADEVVDQWLAATVQLMQTAFQKNGFEVPVVRESAKSADHPGIYLGATMFAQENQIVINMDDWSYVWKTVGPDLVIIGSDRKDTEGTGSKKSKVPLALLGSVKGALDFLREYAEVRFLFNAVNTEMPPVSSQDEEVLLDTRSIAFGSVPRFAIPSDLDVRKTPPLKARPGNRDQVNFYMIANNYFPLLTVTGTRYPDIKWNKVIPVAEYGKTHPEYFALMSNGKRASEGIIGSHDSFISGVNGVGEVALDVTNPDVLHLMFLAAEEQIKKGAKTVLLFPLDSYLLTHCNCARCNAFFGIGAKTRGEVRDRGKGGKLWQIYFSIAERIQKEYPEVKVIVWDYQEHPLNSNVVQAFPANVIPLMQVGTLGHFDKLKGVEIPAGIAVLEETFTAFGIGGPYAPEHTPEYAARIAQGLVEHHVQWTTHDGAARVWGLQAPVYYVYGRILDDPAADYKDIEKEFYTAAFGNVAWHMTQFFDLLHQQISIYSDFFGLYQPAWGRPYARARENYNKWIHQSTYTVDFSTRANALLTAAEQSAKDPDVKARLRLIRIDFDYVNDLGKIFYLQDAWAISILRRNL